MSIVSKSKLSKLKKELEDKIGKQEHSKFIIKTKNGLFLFDINLEVSLHKDKFIKVEKELPGYIVHDYSSYLLENLLIVGDGRSEPVFLIDDIPYSDKLKEGYLNNPKEPFENFTNDELKSVISYCKN